MPLVVTLSGSPQTPSRTVALADHVGAALVRRGLDVEGVSVRDLDPADLFHARVGSPGLRAALDLIARADAVVVATPVYKASYTGLIKAFLDLLPQFGLAGKVVLPLATGGTLAHVLAVDYALRPVLASLGALHVTTGLFVLDKTIAVTDAGLIVDAQVQERLDAVVDEFVAAVDRVTPIAAAVRAVT
ncbi:MAG TPA: NADPH-dependent FMN reductase [Kofleriaceae bacterium]|nr:NADPH-dependent FMN reductase [Kofleriaceae bacterium]